MQKYLDDLQFILDNGQRVPNRTGIDTISVFGMQTRYDLTKGFPAMTTKKLAWKSVVSELLWFLEGSGDERRLCEILHGTRDTAKTTIWTANAQAPYWKPKAKYEGDLARVYGVQWRKWKVPADVSITFEQIEHHTDNSVVYTAGAPSYNIASYPDIDQVKVLIDGIKSDPHGRRHILTAWNPGELDQMALPPCHLLAQFNVTNGKLNCLMYQRSNDFFLGCPFNIASYALLTHMIAQVCGLAVGEFIHSNGDTHIYVNHLDQVKEQISRTPHTAPTLWLNPDIKNIDDFTMDDIKLVNYTSDASIKADMAV
jgi:thymidylate synthase